MSSLEGRLRRLEESRQGRCPECGLLPDGPGYIVLMGEAAPGETFSGDPDERCGHCGRPLWCVIEVVYDSPAGDEGGGGYRWP